jgi:hypothetical protein
MSLRLRVNLDADAVELPLDHRRGDSLERRADVGGRRCQHRLDCATDSQANGAQCGLTAVSCDHRGFAEVAHEHRGATNHGGRNGECLRERVGDDAAERPRAKFAHDEPTQVVGFVDGGAYEQVVQQHAAHGCGAGTAGRGERGDGGVDLAHGERRRGRRLCVDGEGRGPADTEAALARLADQQTDHHGQVISDRLAQQRRQGIGLRRARAGGRHDCAGRHHLGQANGRCARRTAVAGLDVGHRTALGAHLAEPARRVASGVGHGPSMASAAPTRATPSTRSPVCAIL